MLLVGKKALVLGVANEKSIAWAIARQFKEQGACVALSYLDERLKKRVVPLAEQIGADFTFELDVTDDGHLAAMKEDVERRWGRVDTVVHSLAFAHRHDLQNDFSETSREGFATACDVSAFSLVAVAGTLKQLMPEDSSVIAMTYHGSTKVLDGYNVMGAAKAALEASVRYLASDLGRRGVRVNCISAGPVRTLSASAVPGLKRAFDTVEARSPLKRNISAEDVAATALFLASALSRAVTGQSIYVDNGISIMGL